MSEAVLVSALQRVKAILTVPAAEYVPAIPEAWEVIDRALDAARAEGGAGAQVCATCDGRGEIGGWVGQTAESGGWETETCPDCGVYPLDLHKPDCPVITKAQAAGLATGSGPQVEGEGSREAISPPPPPGGVEELDAYDAGLLNDYGGGYVEWWQDYIRAELERAHDHYQSQAARLLEERTRERDEALEALDANWVQHQRVVTAERLLEEVEGALAPFANFAADNTEPVHTDSNYGIWSGNRCERERIVDWFGPTDFHRARQAISNIRKEKETRSRDHAQTTCAVSCREAYHAHEVPAAGAVSPARGRG